jgi:hypothetical protein
MEQFDFKMNMNISFIFFHKIISKEDNWIGLYIYTSFYDFYKYYLSR